MSFLQEITQFIDQELTIDCVSDYPGAMNGLQLENDGKVERIISAVDASLAVVKEAAALGNALLIVHHGMFWKGAQPLTGSFYQKIKIAMEGNLAIYSAHLPLDGHARWGNNILLAKAIGLTEISPILIKDHWPLGVRGNWSGSHQQLVEKLAQAVERPVIDCPNSSNEIDQVAVITGGAGSQVGKIAALGISTFITGEGTHAAFIEAEEAEINVLYAGHYATETFGVKALGDELAKKFSVDHRFIPQKAKSIDS